MVNRRMKINLQACLPAMTLLLLLPAMTLAAQVSAVVDRDRIGSGESLQLQLHLDGSPDGDPDLEALERNWEILGRSQNSQMQVINGNFKRSLILSLSLMPRHSGQLEIPSICFGADCSQPVLVSVSEQSAVTETVPPLILETEATPRQVPVGAQILLTIRLFYRGGIVQASLSEPRGEGVELDVRPLGKDQSYETRRDGYRYQVIERRYVLFPRQAGQLTIPGLQLDAQLQDDSFRSSVFDRPSKRLRRTGNPIQLEVTPPPESSSMGPWLPATQLTLQDDWQQPPTLRVGEPATRTLSITAVGLPAASLPELQVPLPAGWKSYPDQPMRQDNDTKTGIVGTLEQKLALVPTRAGTVELPAVDLDWFDVVSGQWRKAHLEPVSVQVAPAAGGNVGTAPSSLPSEPVDKLPPPAAQHQPAAVKATAPPVPAMSASETTTGAFWPWLALLLGLGWLITLVFCLRRRPVPAPIGENPAEKRDISNREALRAVLTAAEQNDPAATRQALSVLIRLRYPQRVGRELDALRCQGETSLCEALDELDRCIYGREPDTWSGANLASALKNLTFESEKPIQPLPPLYPTDP
ncbi:MAG: BatD family protein [Desulfuromonadaceae bacterium]